MQSLVTDYYLIKSHEWKLGFNDFLAFYNRYQDQVGNTNRQGCRKKNSKKNKSCVLALFYLENENETTKAVIDFMQEIFR